MSELELFPGEASEPKSEAHTGDSRENDRPLAARMRPDRLDRFVGQEHLVGAGTALRSMIESGELGSMILWGPPGSGKTTLARLLADATDAAFVQFSAVTEGVARVREVIAEAKARRAANGRRTILFCDEIHRFNKAQQDAFLPHVEDGSIILIGATTENPSFEVIRPLLSRAPVYVLEALSEVDLTRLVELALSDEENGLGGRGLSVDPDAIRLIAKGADGDARRALGVLEGAAKLAGQDGTVSAALVEEALQHRFAVYDKGGEEHFNLISALHKAVRGSDPDGALYWLARMLQGGEDGMYLARRLVRMAVEDIGLADPGALLVANAARDAYHFLGSPEGDLALAQAAAYLATASKSNRLYTAYKAASRAAEDTPAEPVPLHIRNAPTDLMKSQGYGVGYEYDPDQPDGVSAQTYLPEKLDGRRFYEPGDEGHEDTIALRMSWWEERRAEARRNIMRHEPPEPDGTPRG